MDCSGGKGFPPVGFGLGRRGGREGRVTEGRVMEGRGLEGGCNFVAVVVEQFLGTLKLNGSGPACYLTILLITWH